MSNYAKSAKHLSSVKQEMQTILRVSFVHHRAPGGWGLQRQDNSVNIKLSITQQYNDLFYFARQRHCLGY